MALAEQPEFDVIIVGGGISGLSAARELLKRDKELKVLVLEAKDRVGGRTLSTTLKTASGYDTWDLGGQWVSSTQVNIMALIKELGLDTYPQYSEGIKIVQHGKKGGIGTYQGTIPRLSLLSLLEIHFFLNKLNKISRDFPVDNPYLYPEAHALDGMTAETYIHQHLYTRAAREVSEVGIETVFGALSRSFSALHLFRCSASAGGINQLLETTEGSAQEARIKGGTQQISNLIVKEIGEDKVHILEPVTKVYQMAQEGYVEVITQEGVKYSCNQVIMAIPPHLSANIKFEPPLPLTKMELFKKMPMGNIVKYIITYSKPFWRTAGFSGEIVTDGQNPVSTVDNVTVGPIDIVMDATSENGNAALVCFSSAHRGLIWASVEAFKRKEAILKTLSFFLGEEALSPIDFIEKNWAHEPYTGGCPGGNFVPGVMEFVPLHLRSPFKSVHWAGTEMSTVWIGYMDGAVSAGQHAALEVLRVLRPLLLTADELKPHPNSASSYKPLQKSFNAKFFGLLVGLGIVAVAVVIKTKLSFLA